ncbi:MAG TPA: DUF2007-related protein [Prolixibacteraceae bacterium]|nr:DUF2007-related protein [Prolixibacteraceae bacterium]
MDTDNEIRPVVVFEGNDWQASMVKSLLDNAEIEAFIKDEKMGVLAPWNVAAGGAGAVKIFVSNLDYERAREVVTEYINAEGQV